MTNPLIEALEDDHDDHNPPRPHERVAENGDGSMTTRPNGPAALVYAQQRKRIVDLQAEVKQAEAEAADLRRQVAEDVESERAAVMTADMYLREAVVAAADRDRLAERCRALVAAVAELKKLLGSGGYYSIARSDRAPMGMVEAVMVGNVLERIDTALSSGHLSVAPAQAVVGIDKASPDGDISMIAVVKDGQVISSGRLIDNDAQAKEGE
jgi:hypothetical protein